LSVDAEYADAYHCQGEIAEFSSKNVEEAKKFYCIAV